MAIISILATAGVSAYVSFIKNSRDSKRISIARNLQTVVESASNTTGAPTLATLQAYFSEMGGAPKDPVGGKPVCVNDNGDPTIVCQFVYYRFSDGTYAISYGVEKKENLVNPHYSSKSTPRTYGSFVGNSAAIRIAPSTTDIELDTNALLAVGIIAAETNAGGISTVPAGECNGLACNGGCNGVTCGSGETCTNNVCVPTVLDACIGTPLAGTVCADGTVYVNASLRTTPSDAGLFIWQDGVNFCLNLSFGTHQDWYLPNQGELNTLYTNKDDLGGFDLGWYWTSTVYSGIWIWNQNFNDGGQDNAEDFNNLKVRCVRTP